MDGGSAAAVRMVLTNKPTVWDLRGLKDECWNWERQKKKDGMTKNKVEEEEEEEELEEEEERGEGTRETSL